MFFFLFPFPEEPVSRLACYVRRRRAAIPGRTACRAEPQLAGGDEMLLTITEGLSI
jgi:hypothetical protein